MLASLYILNGFLSLTKYASLCPLTRLRYQTSQSILLFFFWSDCGIAQIFFRKKICPGWLSLTFQEQAAAKKLRSYAKTDFVQDSQHLTRAHTHKPDFHQVVVRQILRYDPRSFKLGSDGPRGPLGLWHEKAFERCE